MPVITIENVVSKPDQNDNYRRSEVEFKPSKAGTYYYMVLPDTVEDNGEVKTFKQYLTDKGITERDFVNEFANDSSLKSGYFQIGGKDIYIDRGSGPADLEEATKKIPNNNFERQIESIPKLFRLYGLKGSWRGNFKNYLKGNDW